MKHKTRILTLRTISVLVLVALLAALSPPSLQTGSVALAQTGPPTLTVTSAGPDFHPGQLDRGGGRRQLPSH